MTPSAIFVINRKSHQVNMRGSTLTRIGVEYGDIPIIYFDDQISLRKALRPLLLEGRNVIYVEGGDGTVLAALTACFATQRSGCPMPQFAILPGGSTNLAHTVLGLRRVDADTLKRRIGQPVDAPSQIDTIRHKALLIETSETDTPFVGFLLSTGSLARLMLYTQDNLHGKRRGSVSIIRAILQLLVFPRSTRFVDGEPLIRPSNFARISDAGKDSTAQQSFSIFSTFQELSLGLKPFWGKADEPIGVTHASWPIQRLRLGIAKAVLGLSPRFLENHGLTSEGCSQMVFRTDGPIILDGEALPMPADRTFKVSVSPDLEFIR